MNWACFGSVSSSVWLYVCFFFVVSLVVKRAPFHSQHHVVFSILYVLYVCVIYGRDVVATISKKCPFLLDIGLILSSLYCETYIFVHSNSMCVYVCVLHLHSIRFEYNIGMGFSF